MGHYPSPLQDRESCTDKDGRATLFTTRMHENIVNSGLPPDKQIIFRQMFEYWADCTLGQVPFIADGDDHCHEKHFLKSKLANNAQRQVGAGVRRVQRSREDA